MTRFVFCVKEFELHHEGNGILARGVTWPDLHYRKIFLAEVWERGRQLENRCYEGGQSPSSGSGNGENNLI